MAKLESTVRDMQLANDRRSRQSRKLSNSQFNMDDISRTANDPFDQMLKQLHAAEAAGGGAELDAVAAARLRRSRRTSSENDTRREEDESDEDESEGYEGGSMEEGEEGGSFSAPDDESDEGPPVQQSFARRGSALLGAIGRRFSGQVEMGVGVV